MTGCNQALLHTKELISEVELTRDFLGELGGKLSPFVTDDLLGEAMHGQVFSQNGLSTQGFSF